MLSGNCRSRTEHWISRNRGQKDSAYAAVWDAEYEVMEAKPATQAIHRMAVITGMSMRSYEEMNSGMGTSYLNLTTRRKL
jgi:hypothetical protein